MSVFALPSKLRFCEPAFAVSSYIAEPFNAVSSLAYVAAGVVSYHSGPRALPSLLIVVGVCSLAGHSIDKAWAGFLDEASMLVMIIYTLYLLATNSHIGGRLIPARIVCSTFLGLSLAAQTSFGEPIAFQVLFSIAVLATFALLARSVNSACLQTPDTAIRQALVVSLALVPTTFLLGYVCWLLDWALCETVTAFRLHNNKIGQIFQFHLLWHVFSAVSAAHLVILTNLLKLPRLGQIAPTSWLLLPSFSTRS